MDIRNEIQKEAEEAYLKSDGKGILFIAMRVGKTRIAINCINSTLSSYILNPGKILIAYPENVIKKSWTEEFKKVPLLIEHEIEYINYSSIHKVIDNEYDMVILDEVHATSEKQKLSIEKILNNNTNVLGLSGSISSTSLFSLKLMGLSIIYRYSVEEAIKSGILPDYSITVHRVSLDDVKLQYKGTKKGKNTLRTEKGQFDAYSYVMSNNNPNKPRGKQLMMLALKRLSVIKNSISKHAKLLSLLKKYKDERVLVFTSFIERAEKTTKKTHHSKNKEKENIEKFKEGKIKHLTLIGTGKSGVTYKNLDRIILDYTSSNSEDFEQKIARCLNNDFIGKKAKIDMIITDEPVEAKWIAKAMENIPKSRVKLTYS